MTRIRPKRYRGLIHASGDLRVSYCGRKVDGWLVEPDSALTCQRCLAAAMDIEDRGN